MKALGFLALTLALGQPAPSADYRAEIEKYRSGRLAELKDDHGFLTLAGLYWLKPGVNTAGSDKKNNFVMPAKAPAKLGVFTLTDGKVFFTADPAAIVTSEGKPITSREMSFDWREQRAVVSGDLRMFPIRRGDQVAIRLRDLKSEKRANFPGLTYYPISTAHRIVATFVPHATRKTIPILNVIGQMIDMESPGVVIFTLNGRKLQLDAVYEDERRLDLFLIFTDSTSRVTTYQSGRYLHAPLPKDGTVILDFNKAYSPPCAFNEFATCPLPPKQNRLPVPIEAGEKRPPH
jgi:uncharacterized protein (DUF1684 family)